MRNFSSYNYLKLFTKNNIEVTNYFPKLFFHKKKLDKTKKERIDFLNSVGASKCECEMQNFNFYFTFTLHANGICGKHRNENIN